MKNNWKNDHSTVTEQTCVVLGIIPYMYVFYSLLQGFRCADEADGTDAGFGTEKYSSFAMFIAIFFWDPFKIYCRPHLESFFIVAMLTPNERPPSPDA